MADLERLKLDYARPQKRRWSLKIQLWISGLMLLVGIALVVLSYFVGIR